MKTIANITKENNELSKLITVIEQAANTYKRVSSKYTDNHIEYFFENLAENHKGFAHKVANAYKMKNRPEISNQMPKDALFDESSAIDMLLLCKDIEKKILEQAREAVRNYSGEEKQLLCKQLTFSEKALFEADLLLEDYE